MSLRKKTILITLVALYANNSFAQNNTDFSAWFITELNYKLNKKWMFSVQEQLRLKESASTIDSYFTQLGAIYSLTKNFDIGVAYRYISENDNIGAIQGYEDSNRLQFDISYGHEIERFFLKYRFRYQTKNQLGIADTPNNKIRLKTSLRYNIKSWKLDPKISAEIFNRFGADNIANNGFNKYRVTFGTSYNSKKMGEFGLFYRFEKEINVINPEITNIVGFKYSYTIKKKKKKKKK